jgi:hypothetical protein
MTVEILWSGVAQLRIGRGPSSASRQFYPYFSVGRNSPQGEKPLAA